MRQEWQANADEALYGLGQHQLGLMNIKGFDLDLWQRNTEVVVPFLVSSRGYGILWDNTSWTRFGDLRDFEFIPAAQMFDTNGKAGGLTGSYFAGANFDRLVATRIDARSILPRPTKTIRTLVSIRTCLPPAISAFAGRVGLSPNSPAGISFKPIRTAASNSGLTANWSSTTGGRAGSPGRTLPNSNSKPNIVTG
jgi:hypothetical protein